MKSLLAINKVEEIEKYLTTLKENKAIINFKIVLQLAMRIEVTILLNDIKGKKWYYDQEPFKNQQNIIKINEIEFDEEETKEYELIFTNTIDLGIRRRLNNFIEPLQLEIKKACPVISFYSYKGGTGRTTSLSYFACWLATHHKKKVVIIDCDFEAPGITNYFDISEERKGIVEYFIDAEYAKLASIKLDIKKDYSHQVRYEYVGKGDIFVIPAGNLSNHKIADSSRTHRSDYFEALSRLDINGTQHFLKQFESFFEDLREQLELNYENSVILIDSRTGFNDTFSALSTLSDIIVGFFGINKQSMAGLTQFLDTYGSINVPVTKEIILVNSISENRNYDICFKEIVNNYISENEDKFTDDDLGTKDFVKNTFRIPRREFLGKLGTSLELDDKGVLNKSNTELINLEFHDKIQDPDSEFKHFFNGVYSKIDLLIEAQEQLSDKNHVNIINDVNNTFYIDKNKKINDAFFQEINGKVDKITVRERVLRTLIDEKNFPKPYADTQKEIPQLNNFYFRDCLKDIFNRDKFVIIGYKGTGKTHIYRSFENSEIKVALCKREKQVPQDYIFVNVIPIAEELNYFSTDLEFMESEKSKIGVDYFFKSFWLLYSWSSIFKNTEIVEIAGKSSFAAFDISKSNTNQILEFISNRDKMNAVNQDLERLDKILISKQKTIILSYDQIDFVVKPNNWNEGVAPLINYWRTNSFSRIFPKIFVRADIFENRLGNITNFNEIQQEKSISLQWSKQELFAYFFKYVFKVSKNDFFALAYVYKGYQDIIKNRLLKINQDLDSEGQVSINNEGNLKFLVELFFGRSAYRFGNKKNNFGETYDWFFTNLTDAKNTISIRPFLDLIQKAISNALTDKSLESEKKHSYHSRQVLGAFYFTSRTAMSHAAERYYDDLANDKGNTPLFLFADFLKFRTNRPEDKQYIFTQTDFNHFLGRILDKYKADERLKEINHIDEFRHLLINNGIIKTEGQGVKTTYVIPFLYRSYFNVGNPNKSRKKL